MRAPRAGQRFSVGIGQTGMESLINLSPEEHSLALMIRDLQAAMLIKETGLTEQTFEDPAVSRGISSVVAVYAGFRPAIHIGRPAGFT